MNYSPKIKFSKLNKYTKLKINDFLYCFLFILYIHSFIYLLSINLFIIRFSTSIWVFFFHSFIFINNFHLLFLQMCLLSLCVFYQPIFISLTNLYFWALYGVFFLVMIKFRVKIINYTNNTKRIKNRTIFYICLK